MNTVRAQVLLIGGTSHVGKSTLAQHLSELRGCKVIATDQLARHPGRPWKTPPERVPKHVAEHYLSLSVDELLADVLRHYQSLGPTVSRLIDYRETNLIIEGSALWPELVAPVLSDDVTALWLTASDDFLKRRIHEASDYDKTVGEPKEMIRKFTERTLLYNRQMMEVLHRLGLPSLNVEDSSLKNSLKTRSDLL